MADEMEVEILEDGTLKITTNAISMPNHTKAEGLINMLVEASSGAVQRVRNPKTHAHVHQGHEHTH